MPFKRPEAVHHASSGYSSGPEHDDADEPPSKRAKMSAEDSLSKLKLYIVQGKLDVATIAELFGLAERNCERLVRHAEDADVIVTSITMRKRFERHVPWDVAKSKAIVTPNWLRDSTHAGKALPCEPYVALQDLREQTIKNCPACRGDPCVCEDSDAAVDEAHLYPSPPGSAHGEAHESAASTSGGKEVEAHAKHTSNIPEHLLPPSPPIETDLKKLSHTSRYACQRASPLVCSNEGLTKELDTIKRSRTLEGEDRNALSYSRAISIIKAYPHKITSRAQVAKLPYLGTKILGLIEEFLDCGSITEARAIVASERFAALSAFASVYGIGPSTARRLYALGLRSIDDLEAYYGVEPEEPESQLVELQHKEKFGRESDEGLGETWVKIALGFRKDLEIKIPRDEVEEMGRVVMRELGELQPGCTSTIVGGGKPESNDVDIVITHPDSSKVKGLCKKFVKRLYERGMVTHVMHLSGFHGHNPLKTTHWDSLEKALTIFILPESSSFHTGKRRRLDLIFALPEVYWCAVIGWSGSIMFQRDLRQWAKDKSNMKFDSSGITRRYDSKPFFPKTEKEVFDLFGLEWIEPKWRNADA